MADQLVLGLYGPTGQLIPNSQVDDQPVAALSEEQRATGMAVSWDSVTARTFRFPPYNPDALIQGKGYDAMEYMLTMAAVRAPANVKRYAVLYKGWEVVPPTAYKEDAQAKEIARAAQVALENIEAPGDQVQDFRQVLFEVLGAVLFGFSCTEIIWRYIENGPDEIKGKWGFERFSAKRQKQIGFDLDVNTLGIRNITNLPQGTGYQAALPPEKFILYTYNPINALPYGQGDLRGVYKHWWSIEALMKMWNVALERFGTPFMLAKGNAADTSLMNKVVAVLDAIRQGASAALPDGFEYELQELAGNSLVGFESAIQWHSHQCAYNILLQQLTTSEGGASGSWALGKVHQDTQEYGLAYVRRDIEQLVQNQVLRRFVRYNYGPQALHLTPRFSLGDWNEVDRLNLAQAFSMLIENGAMYRKEEQIRKKLGLDPLDPETEKLLDQERKDEAELQMKMKAQQQPQNKTTGGSK